MIYIDARTFESFGGWVPDDGYLLAHGLGRAVSDASTKFKSDGLSCRLWVKTRDWVAPQGPGRFQVMLNGVSIAKEFGVGDGEWHWEDGGVVTLQPGVNEARLHDLTGFDGRCSAIAFADPNDIAPPLSLLPSSTSASASYDFVVIGGGYAGMCAAVAAARLGVKTALLQDRPVFGGNASSEIRVGPIGRTGLGPFPRNSDLAYELQAITKPTTGVTSGGVRPPPDDARIEHWLRAETNLTIFLCTKVEDVCMDSGAGRIDSVLCHDWRKGERFQIRGRFFCDATGDGLIGIKSGAETRFDPERREETQETLAPANGASLGGGYGATNYWLTRWADGESPFPDCPWALRVDEESSKVGAAKSVVQGDYPCAAGWNWETGFHADILKEREALRDYNFRAAYGTWDYLKNRSPERERYRKAEMSWMAYVLGCRAAHRIIGDYVLCEQDLTEHRVHPDGVVTTTWFLDMHFPHPQNTRFFPGCEFRSFAYDDPHFSELAQSEMIGKYTVIRPYPIPFRCFYSKDVENLWMAGKDISCTYVGMSSVRVENTTAQMGTMVGRAVSLCLKHGWTPRELGANHFDILSELLRHPGKLTRLAKQGMGRGDFKGECRYLLRRIYHRAKKFFGKPYLEELVVLGVFE